MTTLDTTVPDRKNATVKVGDRVLLCKPHPRAGETGTYMGLERINAIGKWGCLIRFEEGVDGCYVLKADDWEKVQP